MKLSLSKKNSVGANDDNLFVYKFTNKLVKLAIFLEFI